MNILQKTINGKKSGMRKSILVVTMLALFTAGSAMAQIFIDDESLFVGSRISTLDEEGHLVPIILEEDREESSYVPMGAGILLLSALGGAYLMSKRAKNN